MAYTIVFSPEADDQILQLYRYIAKHASPDTAERYTSAIVSYCESLCSYPHRGTRREDIRPGLYTTNYKGNVVIAFAVDDVGMLVSIIGVFYGGQDYEATLKPA